ncbi:hypothetical protein IQ266_11680 [filamentous cyanobacterium LEGE 11480]|uniref:Uncharacterized protein n=1 Tax=Romeriopsis navalis LEGE 11480 TaxID=2777977 RepID=A0A928Z3V3_9CYAN|nr:hypothetical protein [Romeriopsis navalis]MBE9030392.1 hypothetical protein [Romeriopsis navalis LEGE 11480]
MLRFYRFRWKTVGLSPWGVIWAMGQLRENRFRNRCDSTCICLCHSPDAPEKNWQI